MQPSTWHRFLSAAACGILAASAGAQADAAAHLEFTRAAYGASAWTAGPARDGLALAALELPGFRGGALESQQGHLSRPFALADAPEDAAPAFLVEARVFDDAPSAHEELLRWLAGLSSATLAPRAEVRGISAGDVSFVGPSGAGARALSWVAFVRGNVFVRATTLDPRATPELDLAGVAKALDAAVLARKTLAAGAVVPKPEISGLRVQSSAVVAGEAVRLDFTATDPAGGTPHLAWSLAGSGQGYVEARADGWYVFTTGPGELEVTLGVTGSTGTYAEATTRLAVADD